MFVFGPSSCSGLQSLVEGKESSSSTNLTRRIWEVSVLVVAGDRKRKPSAEPSLRQFSESRMLSRRCGCVVALCHVEKTYGLFSDSRDVNHNYECGVR